MCVFNAVALLAVTKAPHLLSQYSFIKLCLSNCWAPCLTWDSHKTVWPSTHPNPALLCSVIKAYILTAPLLPPHSMRMHAKPYAPTPTWTFWFLTHLMLSLKQQKNNVQLGINYSSHSPPPLDSIDDGQLQHYVIFAILRAESFRKSLFQSVPMDSQPDAVIM